MKFRNNTEESIKVKAEFDRTKDRAERKKARKAGLKPKRNLNRFAFVTVKPGQTIEATLDNFITGYKKDGLSPVNAVVAKLDKSQEKAETVDDKLAKAKAKIVDAKAKAAEKRKADQKKKDEKNAPKE